MVAESEEMISSNESHPSASQCPRCGANLPPGTLDFTVCQYCGTSLIWNRQQAETGESQETVVKGLRLKLFSYTDSEGTGLEVFSMLAPTGWEFQGGCQWLLDNPGMPATVAFQMWNPQGAEMFEVLPNMNFTWSNNPLSGMMFPVGSRYFGAEVRQPAGIQGALQNLVIPRFRSRVENLEILNEELLPDLPKLVRSEALVSGGSAEGGKIRIRYTGQGIQYDEEIYAVVEVFRTPITTMFSTTEIITWFVDYVFSFRAAAEQLDNTADIFSVMIGSFHLNPHWYAAFKSIAQQLAQQQIQRIHHIGQIGQMMAQTGSDIRESNLNDWYARQDVYDRLATDWSRTLRSVDGFYDPHREEVVELPSGYGHAWANNMGEYILTEDSNFNPNIHSNLHWEAMEQK
jgi:hypothetical protein